ncbi:MAG: S1 RNA-binding domain-containing protein [Anaerolineales bacterium]|nr:S1 RNA-binding domain-containing protein [Anaerolineales bacterium]
MADASDSMEYLLAHSEDMSMPRRGDVLDGVVIGKGQHGLVLDLGLKWDGVVPYQDINNLPPTELALEIGSRVKVLVVNPVDPEGNLIVSLALARESDDWQAAQKLMDSESVFEGVPCAANRGGLVVPFGRIRGFAPASHLADLPRGLDEDARMEQLRRLVGQPRPFKVIELDPQRQRLVLSERKAIRQWRQQRKAEVLASLREGETRKGVVTSLREFGAFVDIGGADGLIHISELAWRRVEDPGEILQVGQEVETLVVRVDPQANRIGLSLKRLQPNPWSQAASTLQVGGSVVGEVVRSSGTSVHVHTEHGVEGKLQLSEAVRMLTVGTTVRASVVSFDAAAEHLELALVGEMEPAGWAESSTEGR